MWKRATRLGATAAITICLVLTGAAPSSASTVSGLQSALDQVTAAGMPGAFAEVRDGRSTTSAASGVADVDSGRKMKPTMRHRMGSITKTFTATIVLQLVSEGKIQLDAPVAAYLPQYDTTGVTVRMLLNHTSGIPEFGGYGLGLLTVSLPCGDIWGHDGLVFGHSAISVHSANADRQVTVGTNMTHYADPTQPDPIGNALGRLLLTSLCPGTATARQAFTWRSPLHPPSALAR